MEPCDEVKHWSCAVLSYCLYLVQHSLIRLSVKK